MKTIAASVLASLALISTGFAQSNGPSATLVEKQASYDQSDSTGAYVASNIGLAPYSFEISAPGAGTYTPPGGSAQTLPGNSNDGYGLDVPYFTLAALNAAYPDGTYTVNISGSPLATIPLTGDIYPSAIPSVTAVTGGTWKNGVLFVTASQGATLTLSNFTSYASTAGGQTGGHESLNIDPITGAGTVQTTSIQQQYITGSIQGLTQSSTPFTSYTIPPNALQSGTLYEVVLDYDAVCYLNTSNGIVAGIYENETTLYISTASSTATGPSITTQPVSVVVPANVGASAAFTVGTVPAFSTVSGSSNVYFSWMFNGENINLNGSGPNSKYNLDQNFDLTINNVVSTDAGAYELAIYSINGVAYSQVASLSIGAAALPVIVTQPSNETVTAGQSFSFTVYPSGVGPFSYQWYLNGVALPNSSAGAKSQTYSFGSAEAAQAGVYTVTVTNSGGTVTSTGATLTVNPGPTAPTITQQPLAQTIVSGSTVAFNIAATGNPAPTYQWYLGTTAISGATSSLLVIQGATSANAGTYSCQVRNSQGITASNNVNLTVSNLTNSNPGRLVNLSILSDIVSNLTMGFVIGGSGTSGSQTLLVRADGPALTAFGITSGYLADPMLTIVQQSNHATIGTDAGWGTPSSNISLVETADAATGAFAFGNTSSLDSALVETLAGGNGGYSAVVAGKTGDGGEALTEVYDDTGTSYTLTTPRLVNLSCEATISANGSLSVGFVLGGTTSKTVLVRASGPTLASFGVPGTMPDPQLKITPTSSASTVLAANAGWGGNAEITNVDNAVGAFAFSSGASLDSAVVLTLQPGVNYSAVVSSVSGAAGTTLVEVYEVP